MTIDIQVPSVGESVTEGTLARWLQREGAHVQEGEPLFELETDKATGEIPAPASGQLHIQTKEGTTVAVGAVVGQIEVVAAPTPKQEAPKPTPPPAAKKEVPKSMPQPAAAPAQAPPAPAPSRGERETREPMSRIRKTIAERLVAAQHTAAILTTFNEIDMSQVLAIRAQYKDTFKERHGVALGFMAFFIKASVEALKAFPLVNDRIDGPDIVHQHFYDIGVAVSTERGLMVPLIRDADRLTFAGLERAVADYAQKARDGKIAVEDLRGGTFTITNGGVFGSLLSTPLLNPPQTAILGMHTIQKRPVVVDDQIVIRPMMYLALSYDHRLLDGREAVLFLRHVKALVENPQRLLLGI